MDAVEHGDDIYFIGNIGDISAHLYVVLTQCGSGLFQTLRIQVHQSQFTSKGCKLFGHLEAETTRSSGDNKHIVLDLHIYSI